MPGPGIQTRDYRRGRSRARISSFLWPQISPSHSSLRRLTLACAGSFTTTTSNCLKSPRSRRAHSLRFSAPDRAHPGRCQLRVFATSRFGCFDLLRLIHSHLPPPLPPPPFPRRCASRVTRSTRPSSLFSPRLLFTATTAIATLFVFRFLLTAYQTLQLLHCSFLLELHYGWCRFDPAARHGGRSHAGRLSAVC